jgi:hypothetical protein
MCKYIVVCVVCNIGRRKRNSWPKFKPHQGIRHQGILEIAVRLLRRSNAIAVPRCVPFDAQLPRCMKEIHGFVGHL